MDAFPRTTATWCPLRAPACRTSFMPAPPDAGRPMPYRLDEDEQFIQKVVREFARDQVTLEAAHERDRHDRFPTEAVAAAAGLGLTALTLPADQGGAGPTAMALALDEVAQVDPDLAAVLGLHNAALVLLGHAPEPLRVRLNAEAAAGALVGVLATEEAHGSDKGSAGTVARRHPDGYRLSGQKVWGLAAEAAASFLVLADVPEEGLAWFWVPADASGLVLGRPEPLLGLRASGIRTVYLSDVAVEEAHRIGEPGQGRAIFEATLPWHQVATAAALNGCLGGALEAAAHFAATRVQFGEPVGRYQAVSDSVDEVDMRLAASRALTLEAAARLAPGGQEAVVAAARAKQVAAEAAVWMTRTTIRVQGGTGFMREGGTERFARCARALQFVAEPAVAAHDALKRHLLDVDFGPTP